MHITQLGTGPGNPSTSLGSGETGQCPSAGIDLNPLPNATEKLLRALPLTRKAFMTRSTRKPCCKNCVSARPWWLSLQDFPGAEPVYPWLNPSFAGFRVALDMRMFPCPPYNDSKSRMKAPIRRAFRRSSSLSDPWLSITMQVAPTVTSIERRAGCPRDGSPAIFRSPFRVIGIKR